MRDVVQPEVRALTSAIAAGDTDAFERFFHRWFDMMYVEARRVTGRDESFCLDIVQDAMIRVIRSLRPLDAEEDLRRWLRAVVQSCAYDHLRREGRRRRLEREAPAGSEAVTPSRELAARLRWLEKQLDELDGPNLQLLLMRHRFGWTLRQIGEALRLKPGAVDGRLRRLAQTLRRRAREQIDE